MIVWNFIVSVLSAINDHINWTEVVTSSIQTILYLAIPLGLELVTGVLRSTSTYLEAHKDSSWAMRLLSDVDTVMSAQWQTEAKDIREKWDKGQLTKDEWENEKARLKDGFKTKMLERLQTYPAAYSEKFGKSVEDHMEAWLANNKKVISLTKALKENTDINDPAIVQKLTDIAKSVVPTGTPS